jgi:hypothetical protein
MIRKDVTGKQVLWSSLAFLFGAGVLAFMLLSCAAQKTVTNLPPGVTQTQVQQWDSAVQDLDKIAQVTTTLRQTVIALNKQGVIPDGKVYGEMLTAIGKIDQAQISASSLLRAYPQTWTPGLAAQIQQYVNIISAQLTSITQSGLAGIKDTNSQKQVTALIAEITAAVNLVLSLTTS